MSFLNVTLALFLIMDPFGNIASLLKLMGEVSEERQKRVFFREMMFALLVMVLFNFIGDKIFYVLELSEVTVRLTSALILFLVSIKILFPSSTSPRANLPKSEPFLIPLAVPLIAGPSLLATIMLYAHLDTSGYMMILAIIIAWAATSLILFLSKYLYRIFGDNGLIVCERLMGMILILLSIQRFYEGVNQLLHP